MIKEIDERIAEIDKEIEEIMASDLVDEAKVYVLKRERHDLRGNGGASASDRATWIFIK